LSNYKYEDLIKKFSTSFINHQGFDNETESKIINFIMDFYKNKKNLFLLEENPEGYFDD